MLVLPVSLPVLERNLWRGLQPRITDLLRVLVDRGLRHRMGILPLRRVYVTLRDSGYLAEIRT